MCVRTQSFIFSIRKKIMRLKGLRRRFQEWYSNQILKQLNDGVEVKDLVPVDLHLSTIKPIGAEWIKSMFYYFSNKPEIIRNGFKHVGITGVLN